MNIPLTPFQKAYLLFSISAIFSSLFLALVRRGEFEFFQRNYWRFLFKPWKMATFAVALAVMTFIGPHTIDPTWDEVDGFLISMEVFLTAPWAVGILYRAAKRETSLKKAFVAAVALLTCCWIYDYYILLRDGYYPPAWRINLGLSGLIYVLGGLFWNLDWRKGEGTVLAFRRGDWPKPNPEPVFLRLLPYLLPMMGLMALIIAPFIKR